MIHCHLSVFRCVTAVCLFATSCILPCQDRNSSTKAASEASFKENCAICHGDRGEGSPLGRNLHVPDLRSSTIRSKTTAELVHAINDGKGQMPAFHDKLTEAKIQELVDYVRHLHADGAAYKQP